MDLTNIYIYFLSFLFKQLFRIFIIINNNKMVKSQKKFVKKADAFLKVDELKQKAQQVRNSFLKKYKKFVRKNQVKNNLPVVNQNITLLDQPAIVSQSKIKIEKKSDITQDIQRQVQIYKITFDNVNKILDTFQELKVNNERPSDYLAEMYKSDTQMTKIRRILVQKQDGLKQKMQNKNWQKRKKRQTKRQKSSDKKKKIQKYKKMQKQKSSAKVNKAPKMTKFKGKRKQKK